MQLIKLIILSIVIISNPMLHADPKGSARLDQMDANQNGEITLDEFNLSQLKHFNLIDLNGDGTITEAEFLKSISNRFDKMDLNSDEVLKKKEIRKALRKIKKQEKRLQDNQKKQPKPFIKQ